MAKSVSAVKQSGSISMDTRSLQASILFLSDEGDEADDAAGVVNSRPRSCKWHRVNSRAKNLWWSDDIWRQAWMPSIEEEDESSEMKSNDRVAESKHSGVADGISSRVLSWAWAFRSMGDECTPPLDLTWSNLEVKIKRNRVGVVESFISTCSRMCRYEYSDAQMKRSDNYVWEEMNLMITSLLCGLLSSGLHDVWTFFNCQESCRIQSRRSCNGHCIAPDGHQSSKYWSNQSSFQDHLDSIR